MPEWIIIVESRADFDTATDIAKRVICEKIEWLEDHFDSNVQWSGLDEGTKFSAWKNLKEIRENAAQRGVRLPRYLRRSQPLKADGAAAMKALQLITQLQRTRNISAVVLIRDLDNQHERKTGLEQARNELEQKNFGPAIVIGTANCKREAWVLNGFLPQNSDEESVLFNLTKQLTFNPTVQAHRLRETTFDEPNRIRNAKVILEELSMPTGDDGREIACWQETPLETLRQRGIETGLTNYITEVEDRLVPLLL